MPIVKTLTAAEAAWIGGAFSAFGIAQVFNRKQSIRLLTSSYGDIEYVRRFKELIGCGDVTVAGGRWQWTCDEPEKIGELWTQLRPFVTVGKQKFVETVWEQWRRGVIERGGEDVGALHEDGEADGA